jgi:hypothetical protein
MGTCEVYRVIITDIKNIRSKIPCGKNLCNSCSCIYFHCAQVFCRGINYEFKSICHNCPPEWWRNNLEEPVEEPEEEETKEKI